MELRYFKAKRQAGEMYFAAISRERVLEYLGDKASPYSLTNLFNYDLKSLTEIEEREARQAPSFKRMPRDVDFYTLGMV